MSDFRRDGFLIRDALPAEDDALVALWQCCALTRSWNDPYRDLDRARSEQSTRLLVGAIDRRILASAMIGSDGHRGWLYYLAVDPECRGRGYGARLIAAAETHLVEIGCPKLMMMIRTGQPALEAYYAALGYQANPVTVMGKRLIPDA